jgi:hypothetical protein
MAVLTFTWDSAYEDQPFAGLPRNMLDNEIRKMRRGVAEAMAREHNFGTYGTDDGTHKAGKISLALKGDSTERGELTNVKEGSLYLLDDGSGNLKLCIYVNGSWEELNYVDHGEIDGLADDDHTQYAKVAGDTLTGELDMGGRNIIMPSLTTVVQQDLVTFYHRSQGHATLGNVDAVADDSIGRECFSIISNSLSGSGSSGNNNFELYNPTTGLLCCFFPNIYVYNNAAVVQLISPDYKFDDLLDETRVISLKASGSFNYRINYRYIELYIP